MKEKSPETKQNIEVILIAIFCIGWAVWLFLEMFQIGY